MLTPSRLALARARRGLTVVELASKAGTSPASIGDYEHGRRHPRPATTAKLTEALGFPAGFLEADDVPELEVVTRPAPKRQRDAAISAARLAIGFDAWLTRAFTFPEPDVPTWEHHDPETAAEMVRARWGIPHRPAPNMVHLLEAHGVRVFSLPQDCAAAGPFSCRHNGTPYVFLDPTATPDQARFDTARELGHLTLTRTGDAQTFATAFLLPRAGVLAAVPRGALTEQVVAHSTTWHVAPLTLAHRLRDLGLLTRPQYTAVCAQLARRTTGMARRETSQVLTKVFRTLRAQGTTPHAIARELLLDVEELNGLVFGLVLTALPGEGDGNREGDRDQPATPHLTLVRR
ncbi:Zn-dependent peptidase ImmA (M78 family)/DNA-binding XRE family transcriptional regulator [Saccharothrix ecbatanensis]|uniref:Zn-dependent peptidase ImmA (M78 family)/DNA-binding XRE family transcriptional regulator n=1 Tax=Saccharothrix ecbatanensis TaxID=1105145 RepID=A0A7W9HUH3_9PSEU|nr:XRE family transcriptional regulator [Saccharothrix ecbatanensis]MBB5808683.1 Zn-dependent peptidase ImmA (M78 family)/DNA-binding XRE family transcriptional regulator [Saccharothrix ecbatanensis]